MIGVDDFFPFSTDRCVTLAEAIKRVQSLFSESTFGEVRIHPDEVGLTSDDLAFVVAHMETNGIPVTPDGMVFTGSHRILADKGSPILVQYHQSVANGKLSKICLNSKIRSRWNR
ncbi:MAG TPA: hypothetical protein PLK94_03900 [Alphaproteobacteria bacterium]|nr:hypothetical protein [Alphaproteobacteria bacterium]